MTHSAAVILASPKDQVSPAAGFLICDGFKNVYHIILVRETDINNCFLLIIIKAYCLIKNKIQLL